MTADHEEWRDVLSNFECFLEDALREFKRVEVSE